MYQKALIPLDGTKEAEQVVDLVRRDLGPDGTLILLHVIAPDRLIKPWEVVLLASRMEEGQRTRSVNCLLGSHMGELNDSGAMLYLAGAARRLGGDSCRCRCEIVVHESVARGIVDFSRREEVDLIAIYTHDRKRRLARLIGKSIARDVQQRAPIEVRVFSPRELGVAALAEQGQENE